MTTVLEISDPYDAVFGLSEWLRTTIVPEIQASLSPNILGLILFVRTPAMMAVGRILTLRGDRYQRPYVIPSWLGVVNKNAKNHEILERIGEHLNNAL